MDNPINIFVLLEFLLLFVYYKYMQKEKKLDTVGYRFKMIIGLIILIMASIFMLLVDIISQNYVGALLSVLFICGVLKLLDIQVKN